jgi:multidrug efflux system outer membrane protein
MPPVFARAFGASLLLTSCTVGPDFTAPDIGLPSRWKQSATTEPATPAPDTWWTLFRDDELNSLINRALDSNEELAGALARVQSARSLSQIERAAWFPQLGILNSQTFERLSAKSVGANLPNGASLPELERDRYRLFLDLNYELDLWGRVRRGVEGARAREQAQRDLLDAQRLIVAAEVARHHFLSASLEAQSRILKETVALRQEALDLQTSRFQGGLANEMDVARARTELELTRADLVAIERQRGSLEHALAVLCGESPANFQTKRNARLPAPPRVPAGLPSTVLQRRPDLRAAEQNLRAANAAVGVAMADFFPSFRLVGTAGLESVGSEDFLQGRAKAATIGPQVTLPIFQGGRLLGGLGAARARHEESLAAYKQTVLVALREVEDALLDARTFERQRAAVASAVAAAQETAKLARLRYDRGLSNYFEVVDADRVVLSARLSLAQLDGQRLVAAVQMLRALGGGW